MWIWKITIFWNNIWPARFRWKINLKIVWIVMNIKKETSFISFIKTNTPYTVCSKFPVMYLCTISHETFFTEITQLKCSYVSFHQHVIYKSNPKIWLIQHTLSVCCSACKFIQTWLGMYSLLGSKIRAGNLKLCSSGGLVASRKNSIQKLNICSSGVASSFLLR